MQYRLRTLLIFLAIGPPLVAVIGPPVVQWLKQKPLEPVTANGNPYFATYDMVGVDPVTTENVVRKLLAGTPQIRIQLDSRTGKLSLWGPASVHIDVQAIIAIIQRDAAQVKNN
jgi:hypothetical protein